MGFILFRFHEMSLPNISGKCVTCNSEFTIVARSYNRTLLDSKIRRSDFSPAEALLKVFSLDLGSNRSDKFVCASCCSLLKIIELSRAQFYSARQQLINTISLANGSVSPASLTEHNLDETLVKLPPSTLRRPKSANFNYSVPIRTKDEDSEEEEEMVGIFG